LCDNEEQKKKGKPKGAKAEKGENNPNPNVERTRLRAQDGSNMETRVLQRKRGTKKGLEEYSHKGVLPSLRTGLVRVAGG